MEASLEAGAPIEVLTPTSTRGGTASAYPSKDVMLSRRRRELLLPFIGCIVSASTALMSAKVGFTAGVVVGMVASTLCLYQCYRVLKAREAPPRRQPQSPMQIRCRRIVSIVWHCSLLAVTSWSFLIGIVRVASYFEANLLERGVCSWGCVRVSLFRSENCDGFCSPLLLRTSQENVHALVKTFLEEKGTSVVKTIEKEAAPRSPASDGGNGALEDNSPLEGGVGSTPGNERNGLTTDGGTAQTERKMYTYGLSLTGLVGFPSEVGVETSCMPLPSQIGNSTGVLVSVQAQQLFRVGFPDIEGEKEKVKQLLHMLRTAADEGKLPTQPCDS